MSNSLTKLYQSVASSKFNQTIGGGNPEEVGARQSDILLNLEGIRDSKAILDYGCGIGRTMPALYDGLADPTIQLDGCDISEDFLGECRRLYQQYNFRFYKIYAKNEHYDQYKTSAVADNIPQNYYEYAYSYSVFTHFDIDMAAKTLRFVNDVLKTGGRYYFTMFRIDGDSVEVIKQNKSPAFKFQGQYRDGDKEYFAIPSDKLAFAAIAKNSIEYEIAKAGFRVVSYWDGVWRGIAAANIHDAYLIEKL